MQTIARLAVLPSCGVGTAGLLVVLARPHPSDRHARADRPGGLPGVVPAALAAYVLLAGGAAFTGAGTFDAGMLGTGLRVGGVAVLWGRIADACAR
jgi:hypothetical protein